MTAIRKIYVNSSLDIVSASVKGREIARQLGFSATDQSRISLAISELARLLSWGANHSGEIVMSCRQKNGHRGLEMACLVNLADSSEEHHLKQAHNMALRRSLSSLRHLADESLIDEQNEKQARVRLTKWMS